MSSFKLEDLEVFRAFIRAKQDFEDEADANVVRWSNRENAERQREYLITTTNRLINEAKIHDLRLVTFSMLGRKTNFRVRIPADLKNPVVITVFSSFERLDEAAVFLRGYRAVPTALKKTLRRKLEDLAEVHSLKELEEIYCEYGVSLIRKTLVHSLRIHKMSPKEAFGFFQVTGEPEALRIGIRRIHSKDKKNSLKILTALRDLGLYDDLLLGLKKAIGSSMWGPELHALFGEAMARGTDTVEITSLFMKALKSDVIPANHVLHFLEDVINLQILSKSQIEQVIVKAAEKILHLQSLEERREFLQLLSDMASDTELTSVGSLEQNLERVEDQCASSFAKARSSRNIH